MRICLITISSLFLLSCAQEPFPADYLYTVDVQNKVCEQYKIDKKNVKFNFEKEIPFDQCPIVYGFDEKDVGHVMNYVRSVKRKAEACNAKF